MNTRRSAQRLIRMDVCEDLNDIVFWVAKEQFAIGFTRRAADIVEGLNLTNAALRTVFYGGGRFIGKRPLNPT